jgi:sec-independent protein translocase protein TatC
MAVENEHMPYTEEQDASTQSLVEHVEELRWRLFKALGTIAVGAIIAFVFRSQLVELLLLPFPEQASALTPAGRPLVVTGITEGFTVFLKISIVAGCIIALPVVLYQTWATTVPLKSGQAEEKNETSDGSKTCRMRVQIPSLHQR